MSDDLARARAKAGACHEALRSTPGALSFAQAPGEIASPPFERGQLIGGRYRVERRLGVSAFFKGVVCCQGQQRSAQQRDGPNRTHNRPQPGLIIAGHTNFGAHELPNSVYLISVRREPPLCYIRVCRNGFLV